jgi:hypothetical protein
MYNKTKTFSSQFVLERVQSQDFWSLLNKTDDIDKQVSDWVDSTHSRIVNVSAPAMHAEWLDNTYTRKVIILSIVVIYMPVEDTVDGAYPEYRELGTDFADGTDAVAGTTS